MNTIDNTNIDIFYIMKYNVSERKVKRKGI